MQKNVRAKEKPTEQARMYKHHEIKDCDQEAKFCSKF